MSLFHDLKGIDILVVKNLLLCMQLFESKTLQGLGIVDLTQKKPIYNIRIIFKLYQHYHPLQKMSNIASQSYALII